MRVFLDFEASSLGRHGFPIEVAWVFENGDGEDHLIRPAPHWSDWDERAAAIHRIPRETLEREGEPHDAVAARMVEALDGHDLYASAPSWDGKWLSALLRAAGLPRHRLRLKDSDVAQAEAAAAILGGEAKAAEAMARVAEAFGGEPVSHRALDDARAEQRRFLAVVALAGKMAGGRPQVSTVSGTAPNSPA